MRKTATRNASTHPAGEMWNKNNGFGKVNLQAALGWIAAAKTNRKKMNWALQV